VTTVPFPAGPADLCFCRLLLSHLPDPPAVLAAWATQLAPAGLLLVDEVDRIHTADPALRGYLEVAAALLASRGQTLVDALAADLATVAGGGRAAAITWELRQLAWEAGAPTRPAPPR
jgi:SAM-dependent methyltransferase